MNDTDSENIHSLPDINLWKKNTDTQQKKTQDAGDRKYLDHKPLQMGCSHVLSALPCPFKT